MEANSALVLTKHQIHIIRLHVLQLPNEHRVTIGRGNSGWSSAFDNTHVLLFTGPS